MSQLSHQHPDDYEDVIDAMFDAADNKRKRRREEGRCPECDAPAGSHAPTCQIGYTDSFWCQNEIDRRLGK